MQPFFHTLYVMGCWVFVFPILILCAVLARLARLFRGARKPHLIWAGAPMPSLTTASQALRDRGYDSLTVVNQHTSNNHAGQFDVMLADEVVRVKGLNTPLYLARVIRAFIVSLFTRDILHCFFNGGILGHSPLARVEAFLWKLSGGKLVIFAYGQDGFIYADLPDEDWAKALTQTYPRSESRDLGFARRIKAMARAADCVVGCAVHTVNLPRVDIWPVLWYPAPDLNHITVETRSGETVHVAHPTNHRVIKGTQALITAVERLSASGLSIDLDIIENVSIEQSRARLARADIVVDQLLMGYAMTALEGLALGKPVISGFSEGGIYAPFYEKSYLGECPIVMADPETIERVLGELCRNQAQRATLAKAGTQYLNSYHSPKACADMFEAIYANVWNGQDVNLGAYFKPKA